ncbi:MAG: hypothetical protein GKS00_12970 [Alphaproteobacteria bacterium]|nr:hypothetical protein [Alphaproteobacteria bacterium]
MAIINFTGTVGFGDELPEYRLFADPVIRVIAVAQYENGETLRSERRQPIRHRGQSRGDQCRIFVVNRRQDGRSERRCAARANTARKKVDGDPPNESQQSLAGREADPGKVDGEKREKDPLQRRQADRRHNAVHFNCAISG